MLFVKDYSHVILIGNLCSEGRKSKHLIELHYLAELHIGCGTSGIPRKFKAERKIIMSLRQRHA